MGSKHTWFLTEHPSLLAAAAVVGKKEGDGPLGDAFDYIAEDDRLGESSWEKAESRLQEEAVRYTLQKASVQQEEVDLVLAGDLLNQCISSSYGLRDFSMPFLGLYGACSTMAEGLALAGLFVNHGICRHAMALTSSHFCSSERQFRQPLAYGGQRTPTSQWTATAAGAVLVAPSGKPPYLQAITIGKIVDLGITDINNMGAAMAPAAADTLMQYFKDTHTTPADYDRIFTGDLGAVGSELLYELMEKENIDLRNVHEDCGLLLYDRETQDVHAGGSGCGCSAAVFCSHIYQQMVQGKLDRVLFIATGALMSPTSNQQGESIPGIAHLVALTTKPTSQEDA